MPDHAPLKTPARSWQVNQELVESGKSLHPKFDYAGIAVVRFAGCSAWMSLLIIDAKRA
jgi:hypothetical protein